MKEDGEEMQDSNVAVLEEDIVFIETTPCYIEMLNGKRRGLKNSISVAVDCRLVPLSMDFILMR
jgi:hypothetical protein